MMRRIASALVVLLLASPAIAADAPFPSRPVKIVIPYAAGGSLDVVARVVGQKFHDATGQALVLDNRGGAGGLIGADAVAKAAPDGYTLFMANAAQISIAPALYDKVPYDPQTDFVPITALIDTPMILFASTRFPGTTPQDLVALAKAKPGEVPFASAGNGTVAHLAMEMLQQRAGVRFLHVPYRGAAQALGDIAGGSVDFTFTLLASARGMMEAGTLRPLAIASDARSPSLPAVQSFAELGLPGVVAPVWLGMMAPKGTPDAVVARLDHEFRAALATPEVKERLAAVGADILGYGPERFRRMIEEDTLRWRDVITAAHIKLEQ
jgi:tripartite-type tricarboxylate transporter receptor subunit TctC